ncbi:MAG: outer membrane beta-barrel protein [Edaphobacter sp.]
MACLSSDRFRGMRVLKRILVFSCLLSGASMLHAQATATASRAADLKIGGGYTSAASDYGNRFTGGMAYFDFDFTAHLGVEGEFHFVSGPSPEDLYEKTYELGGRYFRTYNKFVPYAKVMYGRGVFNYPAYVPNGPHPNLAYNLLATGAGVDYKALPYLYVRADYEYQYWMGFPPSGLTPQLLTIGVAYHFN